MSTTLALVSSAPARRNVARIYWLEAKFELLKLWRLPAYVLPTLGFPIFFYLLFGLSFGGKTGGIPLASYLIATYGAFGIINAALFGFGIGVAIERGQGWMLLKRASPMPLGAYFTAKIALAVVFGALIFLSLAALGATAGGVELSLSRWLALGGILVAGALPFCAMGLALGYLAGPNSAPAIANLLSLPLAFLSGLWIPIDVLPRFFQQLAPWLPPYHFAQLALKPLGYDRGGSATAHLAYLAAFTVLCLALARLGYRRDEDKTYG